MIRFEIRVKCPSQVTIVAGQESRSKVIEINVGAGTRARNRASDAGDVEKLLAALMSSGGSDGHSPTD